MGPGAGLWTFFPDWIQRRSSVLIASEELLVSLLGRTEGLSNERIGRINIQVILGHTLFTIQQSSLVDLRQIDKFLHLEIHYRVETKSVFEISKNFII